MKNVLITGISGIIGCVIAKDLEKDYQIYGLDLKQRQDANIRLADISDFNQVRTVFGKLPQLDAIIHLAADAYPFAAWNLVLQHNVVGTRNIYECAKEFNVKKVIFASSTHVVGKYPGYPFKINNSQRKLSVDDPLRPDEFYGWSKASGEILARLYFDLYDISTTVLRIGHVLVPGQKRDLDLEKLELTNADLMKFVRKGLVETGFNAYFAVSEHEEGFLESI